MGRRAETVCTKAGRQKAEVQGVVHMKGVGLEGKGVKWEEGVAGGDHGDPHLLSEQPRYCLEGMKEDEIILVFEREQDKIRFPGDEMNRQGWRQEEQGKTDGTRAVNMVAQA